MRLFFILLLHSTILSISFGQVCEKPIQKISKTTKKKTIQKMNPNTQLNIFDEPLQPCCFEPMTGYFRTGSCETTADDYGVHVICATVTQDFLDFSKSRGNDLMASSPYFPGLKAGDKWCLCALRWREALEAGVAPPVNLDSTHKKALQYVTMESLLAHQVK
jgi:uncharacterized protein (DUF2237 family)